MMSTLKPNGFQPAYLKTYAKGKLAEKISRGKAILKRCILCPRLCKVDRTSDIGTICKLGQHAKVANYFPHHGEEVCLSGYHGSGTIFFAGCNLHCVFCQNWDISHLNQGRDVKPEVLAGMMIDLQNKGCHNINFVTPSHVVVPILESISLAIESGFSLPIVYNTSGYDSMTSLRLMDGIVDIYLTDFKFWNVASAKRYLSAPEYPWLIQRNLKEMYRQVGDLVLDQNRIAQRGLIIRHLFMPNHPEDATRIFTFIAQELSPHTAVNIMAQYHPTHEVSHEQFSEINRRPTLQEQERARKLATSSGLLNCI